MEKMSVQITCSDCGSSIEVHPTLSAKNAKCTVCNNEEKVNFSEQHLKNELDVCPCCDRKDFYSQKDFNRKLGVILFVIAAILSIWTYGISFIILYAFDFFLFKKLKPIVICYKCQTIFRNVANISKFQGFDHEMNDRIVYSDHNFEGRPLSH